MTWFFVLDLGLYSQGPQKLDHWSSPNDFSLISKDWAQYFHVMPVYLVTWQWRCTNSLYSTLSALNVTLIKNSKCSFGHETSRQSCVYVITSLLNDCLWTCHVRAPSSVTGMQSKASGSFNNVIIFVGPEAKVVTQTWTRCVTVEFQPVLLLTFFCISVFVVKNYSKFFPHD